MTIKKKKRTATAVKLLFLVSVRMETFSCYDDENCLRTHPHPASIKADHQVNKPFVKFEQICLDFTLTLKIEGRAKGIPVSHVR